MTIPLVCADFYDSSFLLARILTEFNPLILVLLAFFFY